MDALTVEIYGIKCDAEGCDYHDDSVRLDNYPEWLNKPCPKCGANLLTQTDLDASLAIHNFAKAFSEIHGPQSENEKVATFQINMDGNGINSIKRVDKP